MNAINKWSLKCNYNVDQVKTNKFGTNVLETLSFWPKGQKVGLYNKGPFGALISLPLKNADQ